MKTIIIEDEAEAIDCLKFALDKFCTGVEVIGEARTVSDGVDLIRQLQPDLVFLDIDLNGQSGFEVLEAFEEISFMLIFVTAYEDYSIRAIRSDAVDYLLKPLDPEDLENAVARCRQRMENKQTKSKESDPGDLIAIPSNTSFRKIGIPTNVGIRFIEIERIVRLESSNNYTYIHFQKEKPILVSKTLKSFEKILPSKTFIRIHQSHIINLDCITLFDKTNGNHLSMMNNEVVPISKSHRTEVRKRIAEMFPSL